MPGGRGPGAVEEGEMEVDFPGHQVGSLQPQPDAVQGQIRSDLLYKGGVEGEGELIVDGRQFDLQEAASVHTVQGENLPETGEEVTIQTWRVTDPHEASRGHPGENSLEADA